MIAGGQEGGGPGESCCGHALKDELLPSPAGRTASAQDSLSLGMLKWTWFPGERRSLPTPGSLQECLFSEALPHSTISVEKMLSLRHCSSFACPLCSLDAKKLNLLCDSHDRREVDFCVKASCSQPK